MFRHSWVFAAIVWSAMCACAQDGIHLAPHEQLERPYTALLDTSSFHYSSRDVQTLWSTIEQERNQQIDACHKDEKHLQRQLKASRNSLKALNTSSPRDTLRMADARAHIHLEIAAAEHLLADKHAECEHTIPAAFEIRLAKADILKRWPKRRERVIQAIEAGRARERKHGDIDDIGYRNLTEDQAKDISVGEQATRQLIASGQMPAEINDPFVRQYIQDLAATIARNSDLKVPLHTTVLSSSEVNSIAVPGGFLFLTSGLLLACESETELAGVISQQIAHIAARHAIRGSKRAAIGKLFVPAAQIVMGFLTGGAANAGAYYGMNYGFQGLGLLVDRTLVTPNGNAQKEADQLGMQYAWKAGFDPKGFISFLDTLAKTKDYSRSQHFLITKPAMSDRLLDAFTELQFLPPQEHRKADSGAFQTMKDRLRI